jgi:cellulose synthase (UDP-forming)
MTNPDLPSHNKQNRAPISILAILAITILIGTIFALWIAGVPEIIQIFNYILSWYQQPISWLQVPEFNNIYYLLIPTLFIVFTVLLITKISPEQQIWSRFLVVLILLTLMGRYILWRFLVSLNFNSPLNCLFSLLLLFVELYFISRTAFQAFLLLKIKDRREEVEKNAIAVTSGKFNPSVDILILTYNESAHIIQSTVIGCQALEYANKKIYVLDDNRREEIKNLCQKLGCNYITRPDNKYAKAGNLNHAISQTFGELIVIFDADFIPNKSFLTRTVGFFQDPQIGFLQTSQHFYNSDLIAYNLGLSDVLPHTTETYHSHYQLLRDGVDCTGLYGSSLVLNRAAIEKIGGFVTASLSEDYFTGISISAQGYKSVYLNEKLSAGLGTENMTGNLTQCLRWSRGTLQGFFIKENPCTIPGLKLIQRITHLQEGLLSWIGDLPRICLLLTPFLYTLSIVPIQASLPEILYFYLPYYLVYFTVYTWLNNKTQPFLISDIYTSIHCIPLSFNFFKVLLNPFSAVFQVTPKGVSQNTSIFHWDLALPLIVLLIINLIRFSFTIYQFSTNQNHLAGIGITWSAYNLLLISCILASLLDAPKVSVEWFKFSKPITIKFLKIDFSSLSVTNTEISEFGIKVTLNQHIPHLSLPAPVLVEFKDDQIELSGEIVNISREAEFSQLQINFENLTLNQQRYLVETLFCTPHQWQRRETPGDWQILILLLKNAVLNAKNYFLSHFSDRAAG